MRPRLVAVAAAATMVVSGCTSGSGGGTPTSPSNTASSTPATTGPASMPPATALPSPPGGPGSAQAARERLCRRPPYPKLPRASAAPVPDAITQVERQVEEVRGLDYVRPVAVDPVTHRELVKGLDESFETSFPKELYRRRSLAWQTIGVVPDGTDVRRAIHRLLSSQVIGYYDPVSKQLVFIGTENPSPFERFTLAHELTHADDDQHFDLSRLNGLEKRCADEALAAAIGAVEGNAVFFQFEVARRFFSAGDMASIGASGGSPPDGVPQFVQDLFTWPYTAGLEFVGALRQRGGLDEVNGALQSFPVSTEQVIHPDRYPGDVPTPIDVPQLAPKLGKGWHDLDVMDVGEAWLDLMVLPSSGIGLTFADPAAGWDGGLYRAWTDGKHVAVVLETAWDSEDQGLSFAAAANEWLGDREDATIVGEGGHLRLLFASDRETLALLKRRAG